MAKDPDVVLLLIGINDYTNYQTASGTPAQYNANLTSPNKLATVIDRFLSFKPNLKIFVASLLPVSSSRASTYPIASFNSKIPAIVAARANQGKKVFFVDLNTEAGINPDDTAQLNDGLHPTSIASQKIANTWYNVLINHF
jgi:lysophospholipase L1-like esterase